MPHQSGRVDLLWSLPGRSGQVCLASADKARSYRALVDREDAKAGLAREWEQMSCQHVAKSRGSQ